MGFRSLCDFYDVMLINEVVAALVNCYCGIVVAVTIVLGLGTLCLSFIRAILCETLREVLHDPHNQG